MQKYSPLVAENSLNLSCASWCQRNGREGVRGILRNVSGERQWGYLVLPGWNSDPSRNAPPIYLWFASDGFVTQGLKIWFKMRFGERKKKRTPIIFITWLCLNCSILLVLILVTLITVLIYQCNGIRGMSSWREINRYGKHLRLFLVSGNYLGS